MKPYSKNKPLYNHISHIEKIIIKESENKKVTILNSIEFMI
jgi:hypothetical protein